MKVKSRYGHKKGLTTLYVDLTSNSFITCGSDNDIRIWRDIDDEDVVDFNVDHTGAAVACHGDTFYVGAADAGFVKAYDKITGKPRDGCITNFTLPVAHMVINPTGEKLLVSSREVGVARWVTLANYTFKTFGYEHDAQVLSVALDPKEEYMATGSGDGSVRIWSLSSGDCEHSIPNILMKTNDLRTDRPLARLCWQPKQGEFLAVPVRDGVQLYKRQGGWDLHKTLRYQRTTASDAGQQQQHSAEGTWFSVCAYSWCGQYLAAGSLDGEICVWNASTGEIMVRKQFSKKAHICSIAWDPIRKDEVLFCDVTGEVGALKDLCLDAPPVGNSSSHSERKLKKCVIDDSDADAVNVPAIRHRLPADIASDGEDALEDKDQEQTWDIGALKRRYNNQIGLDEDGNTLELADHDAPIDDGFASIRSPALNGIEPAPVALPSWRPTPQQPAFVVGSMPEEMPERCMKWNADGMVIHYNSEGDNTIEVRYHDSSVHHQFTINNCTTNFTMGDLSAEAVALASRGNGRVEPAEQSLLRVIHLRAWDHATKDWTICVPQEESIQCLCLGSGWVACVTDLRVVRMFTISGIQRHIFTLPGPVMTMCAQSSRLAIVYHDGMGVEGDQCLAYAVYKVHLRNTKYGEALSDVQRCGRVALSPKSTLTWLGLLPNGSLCAADSDGIVRILNLSFHSTWLSICDINATINKKSETAWIVSAQDNPAQIRYVICKNEAHYPQINPKPPLSVVQWRVPVCNGGVEREDLESRLILNDAQKASSGMFYDDGELSKCEIETVVKLFALSCKTERDCRSLEIARLMPTSASMQILIKLAVSQKRHVLARKIGELALQRAEEEETELMKHQQDSFQTQERMNESTGVDEGHLLKLANRDDQESRQDTRVIKLKKKRPGEHNDLNERSGGTSVREVDPLFRENDIFSTDKLDVTDMAPNPSPGQRLNPFKKIRPEDKPLKLAPGASVFDTLTAASTAAKRRDPGVTETSTKCNDNCGKKPKMDSNKKQATLQTFSTAATGKGKVTQEKELEKKEAEVAANAVTTSETKARRKTGFTLWLEEHEEELILSIPDDDNTPLTKYAARCFRQLDPTVRQEYVNRAQQYNDSLDSPSPAVSVHID